MKNQFEHHPVLEYNGYVMRDFTAHIRILERIKEDDDRCADYEIQEGETPTQLAQDFYGEPRLFWVLLNLNDRIDPWTDWPMPYNVMLEHTKRKYPDKDIFAPRFYGFEGIWFEENRIEQEALPNFPQFESEDEFKDAAFILTYIEYEERLNDEKKLIRVVRPEEMGRVLDEIEAEIKR